MRLRIAANVDWGTAADVMSDDFPRIEATSTVRDAVQKIVSTDGWDYGLVLGDDGEVRGAVGRREVLRGLSRKTGRFFHEDELSFAFIRGESFRSEVFRQVWDDYWHLPVSKVMSKDVLMVEASAKVDSFVRDFARDETRIAAVTRSGRLVGAIDTRRILRRFAKSSGPRGRRKRTRRAA